VKDHCTIMVTVDQRDTKDHEDGADHGSAGGDAADHGYRTTAIESLVGDTAVSASIKLMLFNNASFSLSITLFKWRPSGRILDLTKLQTTR
jgi:hypothetical protein